MKMKRRITVFVATFAVVMIGGAALAAVGVVSPPTSSPTSNIAAAATEPEAAPTSPAISTSPDALTPADTQPRLDIRLDASDLVPVHEFTAHQRYEVVDGWPVVNYYWGTAKPGAEVHRIRVRTGNHRSQRRRQVGDQGRVPHRSLQRTLPGRRRIRRPPQRVQNDTSLPRPRVHGASALRGR